MCFQPDRPSSGLSGLNHGHNCVAEACSPDEAAHIFCREVPEIPYVYSFNGSLRTTSPTLMAAEFRKSCGILIMFMISAFFACCLGVQNGEHTVGKYRLETKKDSDILNHFDSSVCGCGSLIESSLLYCDSK